MRNVYTTFCLKDLTKIFYFFFKALDLGHNGIREIEPSTFGSLTSLQVIKLEGTNRFYVYHGVILILLNITIILNLLLTFYFLFKQVTTLQKCPLRLSGDLRRSEYSPSKKIT